MYKRLSDISTDLNKLHENGLKKGYDVGWD